VQLGQDYPQPIIEHDFARERALGAYRQIKDQGQRS
jgi:deoxyribodipyrimidine photolyase